MRRHNNKAQIDKSLSNDKVIDNKVPYYIKGHVNAATEAIGKEITRNQAMQRLDI